MKSNKKNILSNTAAKWTSVLQRTVVTTIWFNVYGRGPQISHQCRNHLQNSRRQKGEMHNFPH